MSKDSGMDVTKMSGSRDMDDESDAAINDKQGIALPDILDEILDRKEALIIEWYEQVSKEPPKVDSFLDPANASKNRFKGVMLYDKSRVMIKDKLGSDYYHASFVDSYDKKDGYILAQAPFNESTEADFWRMVMNQKPVLIVLLGLVNGIDGTSRMRCFWPSPKQDRQYCKGKIRVKCTSREKERDHDVYEFLLSGSGQPSKKGLRVQMMQNLKWLLDKDIPDNLLDFRAIIQIALARAANDNSSDGPLMFVCPTGVHRCGTFAVLNILSDRLKEENKVGLNETLSIVRSQRYGVLTYFDHYKVLHELIVRQAVSFGMVNTSAVARKR